MMDEGTFKNKTVRSDWRGRSLTWKMEEALQKNQADETCRVGALRSRPPSDTAGEPQSQRLWKSCASRCQKASWLCSSWLVSNLA